jgi:hypothetical protein
MTSGCGCWVDSNGYWHLSPACRAEELAEWRRAMASASYVSEQLRRGTLGRERSSIFRTIDGKVRLIEDVQLPEDSSDVG